MIRSFLIELRFVMFKVVLRNTTLAVCSSLEEEYVFRKINIYIYIYPRSAKNYPPGIANFIFIRAKPSCTFLFTCRPTALVFISCVGKLENLYSRTAIMGGVSLLRHNMYHFNSYGCNVAQFSDVQYTHSELDD